MNSCIGGVDDMIIIGPSVVTNIPKKMDNGAEPEIGDVSSTEMVRSERRVEGGWKDFGILPLRK